MLVPEDLLTSGLGGKDLLALADYYDGLAGRLRTAGQRKAGLETESESQARLRFNRFAQAGQSAAELLERGANPEQLVEHFSRELNVQPETIRAHIKRAQADRAKAAKTERDRRVLQHASLGWSNKKIADSEGLHPNTICRILRKALRANGAVGDVSSSGVTG